MTAMHRTTALLIAAVLAAAPLAGCGRYGPPVRAPEYREGYTPPAEAGSQERESERGQQDFEQGDEEEAP